MAYMAYMVCHDVDYGHGDDGWSIFGSKPTPTGDQDSSLLRFTVAGWKIPEIKNRVLLQ